MPSEPQVPQPSATGSVPPGTPVMLDAVLEALRLRLTQALVHPITVGVPDGPQPAIWVWPWRLSTDPAVFRPVPRPGGPVRPYFTKVVDVLVLVEPSTDRAWLSLLDQALSALADAPVLQVGAGTANIVATTLSATELAAIFQSAGIRLVPVVSAAVHFLSN